MKVVLNRDGWYPLRENMVDIWALKTLYWEVRVESTRVVRVRPEQYVLTEAVRVVVVV